MNNDDDMQLTEDHNIGCFCTRGDPYESQTMPSSQCKYVPTYTEEIEDLKERMNALEKKHN